MRLESTREQTRDSSLAPAAKPVPRIAAQIQLEQIIESTRQLHLAMGRYGNFRGRSAGGGTAARSGDAEVASRRAAMSRIPTRIGFRLPTPGLPSPSPEPRVPVPSPESRIDAPIGVFDSGRGRSVGAARDSSRASRRRSVYVADSGYAPCGDPEGTSADVPSPSWSSCAVRAPKPWSLPATRRRE